RVLDLFKVRRCQIKIRRDPTFPGCLYSEMKMCLAPCFAGCTKEEYDVEVQRLVHFLETSGGSLRSTIEEEREKASEQLDFERAAALHKKVEKLDEVLRGRPELTRRIQDLDAVILQRAAEEQTIGVFRVQAGRLAEPFSLRFGEIASQPRSAEHIFREQFESSSAPTNGEPFSGSAQARTFLSRNRHLPRAAGRKNGCGLYRGSRRGRRERHQRDRRCYQLPVSTQRAKYRHSYPAASSKGLRTRRNRGVHQGRLPDARRFDARRPQ